MSLLAFQRQRYGTLWLPTFVDFKTASPNTPTHTYSSITFPAGKMLVACWENCQSGESISTVVVNGVGATRRATGVAQTDSDVSFWDATVSAGTASIVTTSTSGNFTRGGVGVWDVTGGSYVTSATIGTNTENPCDLSVNTTAGDSVFVCAVEYGTSTSWTPTGYAEDYDSIVETHAWHGGFQSNVSGGSPQSFTATPAAGSTFGALSVVYRAD